MYFYQEPVKFDGLLIFTDSRKWTALLTYGHLFSVRRVLSYEDFHCTHVAFLMRTLVDQPPKSLPRDASICTRVDVSTAARTLLIFPRIDYILVSY